MQRGHTLVEMMVVLAMLGIVAAFAVPSIVGAQAEMASHSAAARLAATLRAAQAEAHESGARVRVLLDGDGQGYEVARESAGSWALVERGSFGPASCETNYPGGAVVFSGIGWPRALAGAARAGTFTLSCAGRHAAVVVQMGGAVRCR